MDSRVAEEGAAIRRRRECLHCGRRFTTYERLEELVLAVRKRSGRREPFERAKIVAGARAATKNRPVAAAQLELLAVEVEDCVRLRGVEVSSAEIGQLVLERLRSLDAVAAVRFASVYKDFADVRAFQEEVVLFGDPPGGNGTTEVPPEPRTS